MKTVALKNPRDGTFQMIRLSGFGTISSDNREDYGTRVSLGNVKTSLDLKESRIVTLEDDKVVKDSKIATLESDKNDKDTRVAALESDKNSKDSKISDIESDITSLTSRVSTLESSEVDTSDLATKVSLGNVRVSLGNLATRVSSLETLGISGISNAVSWTNLTEINSSGEKLTNGDFSSVTNNAPTNWTVTSGTLDQIELANGVVAGDGGEVILQQRFNQTIPIGTNLVIKQERTDSDSGGVIFWSLNANGGVYNQAAVLPATLEYTVANQDLGGIRISTKTANRKITSVSLFQGAISGGTVQAYAGGGLEKISGASGYNSGGLSVNYIPGNSDGYFQFQLAQNNKALRVGLVYADADYSTVSPFGLDFNATGNIDNMNPHQDNITTYAQGDWFRVRHYASSNQVHFQKRQTVGNGQDYVTFLTCSTTTNGSDLYLDVAFDSVGGRINDVTIVT